MTALLGCPIFDLIFIGLGQNVCVCMKALMRSKIGHGGSKSRLGQILKETCEKPRGHIFCPIFIKLGQKVDLNESLNEF